MEQLALDKHHFDACDIEIVVICPENKQGVEKYLQGKELPFLFVHDENHELAKEYHQEVNLLKLGRMPLQILMSNDGDVLYQYFAKNMKDITPNTQIFENYC